MEAQTCPKCRTQHLAPARGALAAPALGARAQNCGACSGLWIPHAIVEQWRNAPFVEIVVGEEQEGHPEADRWTGLCPNGHGILIRARVHGDEPYHVERCPRCWGIWLDAGEWQKLAAERFLEHLDDLWDPEWQLEQRIRNRRESLDRALSQAIGEQLFDSLKAIAEQLVDHPARAQALAWFDERLSER